MSMLAELERRNVIRAGAVWLALSWLLVAMCALLFPALGLPISALRWIILALALGLLPLLIFAWRYEITPQGVRLDRGPGFENPQRAITASRLELLTVVLVLGALSLSLLRQFIIGAAVEPVPAATEAQQRVESSVSAPARPARPADPRSLAVLPFTNLSPSSDDAYFAEGLAEELLNVLARVEGLKVTSRTSSFVFRDTTLDSGEIAAQLGVASLVEGSVRRDGDDVRISVQLVDADTDLPRWSRTYERRLIDIFRIQEEISQAIADALADSLGVREVQVAAATTDLRAYEAYLRGRQLFAQRGANLPAARELLQRAIEIDPKFADAWAALAGTWYVWRSYAAEPEGVNTLAQARFAAERALALQPLHPSALAVSARVAADGGDRVGQAQLIAQALALEPNNANTWLWQGLGLFEAGHLQQAHASFSQAQQLDPLSGLQLGWLGISTALLGDRDGGIKMLQQAHAMGWRGPASRSLFFIARSGAAGDVTQAYLDWLHDDDSMPTVQRDLARSLTHALTDPAQLAQAQRQLLEAAQAAPDLGWATLLQTFGLTDVAVMQSLRADPMRAQALLFSLWYPDFREFRQQPAFFAFAEQQGLIAYWRQHGPPDGCDVQPEPEPHLECVQ